jgi:acetoin utilization deacetylase AcuC-like enzyme
MLFQFMLTIYSEDHKLHHGNGELMNGQIVPCFELPRRAELILERVRAVNLGEVIAPRDFGLAPITRVHSSRYVHFLKSAWAQWSALGRSHDALPMTWPMRGMNDRDEPQHIEAKLGFYSFDGGAPIQAGTWKAVYGSAQVALEGAAQLNEGLEAAFSLCRPPGHHAASDLMGGYCYLNNAAIAAQALRDAGAARVAILDIDYHHGNGTQDIFYARDDALLVNLHGDPIFEYPFFLGHASETGIGAGEGYNLNLPLPSGTGFSAWSAALEVGCKRIAEFVPDALVVSLGVDTFKDDPISQFKFDSEDYLRVGARIAALGVKTLFVMEGGYAVEEIGVNAVNVLMGYENK